MSRVMQQTATTINISIEIEIDIDIEIHIVRVRESVLSRWKGDGEGFRSHKREISKTLTFKNGFNVEKEKSFVEKESINGSKVPVPKG
jgi:hypothetical protein